MKKIFGKLISLIRPNPIITINADLANYIQLLQPALDILHHATYPLTKLPKIQSLDSDSAVFQGHLKIHPDSVALDLGCGTVPRNPFQAKNLFGIDIREDLARGIKYADLAIEPIPFEEKKFDVITAYDFLEHIPRVVYLPQRRFSFVELMNEIYRTLKPGGIFFSLTPIFPYATAFRDPTHVNFLTEETFPLYFDDQNKLAAMYGFKGSFKVVYQAIYDNHLVSLLQKV